MQHLFKKIPQKKVSDRVLEQIRSLITGGKIKPGEKLPPERELTTLFNVSRSSVREAMLKLECLGFVEQRHGEGTFVRSMTESPLTGILETCLQNDDFISDLMEIRYVLETWGAAAAAERATEAEIKAMQSVLLEMKAARNSGKIGYELNVKLHFLISSATRNTFLVHMMNTISGWIKQVTSRVYASLYDDLETYDALLEQHAAIVDAIAKGDGDSAFSAMAEHLKFAQRKAETVAPGNRLLKPGITLEPEENGL